MEERTFEELLTSVEKAKKYLEYAYKNLKSLEATCVEHNDYLGALDNRYTADGLDSAIHALRAVINGDDEYLDNMIGIFERTE